ncbi:MAG: NAD(P)-binding domain-containing protein [Pseudomonadota bacterium]
MARIGFLGTGAIAAAMVRGIAQDGHRILVSDRGRDHAATLSSAFENVEIASNRDLVAESEIVVLCLMAETARSVLPTLPFRTGQQVISVMLGVDHAELTKLCTPAKDIAITIPLPFVAEGGCPLPVWPDASAVEAVFGQRNPVIALPSEAALNPHFAATALSSVVLAQMAVTTRWLSNLTGDEQGAEAYVVAMLGGFLGSLPTDGAGRIDEAIAALDTEGGLNQTLRERMRAEGSYDALEAGLDAFRERLGLPGKRA